MEQDNHVIHRQGTLHPSLVEKIIRKHAENLCRAVAAQRNKPGLTRQAQIQLILQCSPLEQVRQFHQVQPQQHKIGLRGVPTRKGTIIPRQPHQKPQRFA